MNNNLYIRHITHFYKYINNLLTNKLDSYNFYIFLILKFWLFFVNIYIVMHKKTQFIVHIKTLMHKFSLFFVHITIPIPIQLILHLLLR